MRILNFGSLNLDYVYQVEHFVQPGETISAHEQSVNPGGKGLNQSTALARAGVSVMHAGCVGAGGEQLVSLLEAEGADTHLIRNVSPVLQGNAMIQVNPAGENCIVLFGGSNRQITPEQVRAALDCLDAGDFLLLQNEISCMPEILSGAAQRGLTVILNPSPFEPYLKDCDLGAVRWLLVNEVEAEQFCGGSEGAAAEDASAGTENEAQAEQFCGSSDGTAAEDAGAGTEDEAQGREVRGSGVPDRVWERIRREFPQMSVVITLGSRGAVCFSSSGGRYFQPAFPVKAVDTTGAGDTFTGYFAAALAEGRPLDECLKRAALAAAIAVTRPGAAGSIPKRAEVEQALAEGRTAETEHTGQS